MLTIATVGTFAETQMRLTLVSRESLGQWKSISTVVRPLTIATALRTVEIDSATSGVPARVIIFTAAAEAKSFDGSTITVLTADEAADIIAIQ